MNLLDLLARPIAYHRCFVALGAGVTGAVMLSQAIYWARRTNDNDGWFYKSQAEWEEETGLKRTEQEKARKMLISIGVLDECRRGLPAKLYYRVNEDCLVSLLSGNLPTPTIEEVLSIFQTTLRGMSKTGHMRATKAGVRTEYVDYAEVLKNHGMTCSCCGKPITYGPGKKPMCLSFDHVHPIAKGGSHTADNLRPAHFGCNAAKCDHFEADLYDLDEANNSDYGNQTKSAYAKQTGSLEQSEQAGLPEAIILTENTTETTTESTTDIHSEADESASAASGEAVPAVLSNGQQEEENETVFQSKCRLLWTMYKAAFRNRYGIDPVRNAKVNTQVKQIVQRLGEEGALVAEFYVYQVNEAFVVKKTHDLGLLLKDAESYRNQWAMGRAMTQTRAQQIDSTQANASAADEAIAMLRAREQGVYHP